jgi:hypothetical protein
VSSRLTRAARAGMDVLIAVQAVIAARRKVRRTPIGSLVATGEIATPQLPSALDLSSVEAATGWRWAKAVDRALRLIAGDSACLVRATALRSVLLRAGLADASVRIGVRRGGAKFEAHAWVELRGTPIAESGSSLAQFAPLEGVTVA